MIRLIRKILFFPIERYSFLLEKIFEQARKVLFIVNIWLFYREEMKQIKKNNINFRNNSTKKISTYEYKMKWSKLCRHINIDWYRLYSYVSGIENQDYVPRDIYLLIIEPRLNDMRLKYAYVDKNFYEKYFVDLYFPQVLLRDIRGVLYNGNYSLLKTKDAADCFLNEQKVILKPSMDSGCGKGVELFTKSNDGNLYNGRQKLSLEYIESKLKRDWVMQKYIEQHEYFSQFNSTSLNTIRVYTYRSVKSNDVVILHAILRMGREGAIVDNLVAGGIACKINEEGFLNDYAVDKYGNKYFLYANNNKFAEARKVFKYSEIKSVAIQCAKEYLYYRVLGLDLCVDHEGKIKIVEINNYDIGISFHQMAGDSLFKEYTDEVIEYCLNNGD
ncbi:MAG: hypothetical protein HQL26_01305 [Candidatus Omnitrophica bacterium]|nr:hypothetical protein [Candidatus Omnitrophota bacterium]